MGIGDWVDVSSSGTERFLFPVQRAHRALQRSSMSTYGRPNPYFTNISGFPNQTCMTEHNNCLGHGHSAKQQATKSALPLTHFFSTARIYIFKTMEKGDNLSLSTAHHVLCWKIALPPSQWVSLIEPNPMVPTRLGNFAFHKGSCLSRVSSVHMAGSPDVGDLGPCGRIFKLHVEMRR